MKFNIFKLNLKKFAKVQNKYMFYSANAQLHN